MALVVAACILTTAAGQAQVCAAAPSLQTTGWRAGIGRTVADSVQVWTVTGALGGRTSRIWSGATVGLMRLPDLDRTALTAGAAVGLEAPFDTASVSGLCPFVRGGAQAGPRDILGTGVDYSDLDLGVGLSVGRALTRWDDGMVATAIEGSYQRTFYRYTGPAGSRSGYSDTKFVTASLGLAIGRLLVRFSVAQPLFVEGASLSYGVSVSLLGSAADDTAPAGRGPAGAVRRPARGT